MKAHEIMSVFYINKPIFNPQKTKGNPYVDRRVDQIIQSEHYTKKRVGIINYGTREPISVINQRPSNYNSLHPTQKPVPLLQYLIKTYTNPGATVLDFCMGSGSTGVAAADLNRNFIGIEKERKYFDIAKRRIIEANQKLF